MKGEKYGLAGAQHEAEKLVETIESGRAKNNTGTGGLVEQKVSKRKEWLICLLKEGNTSVVVELKKFNLPDSVVQSAANEGLIYLFKEGDTDRAVKLKEQFNLPDSVVQSAAKEGMICLFKEGDTDLALNIKEQFNLPDSVVQSADVQSAAKEGMICLLTGGHIDRAIKLKKEFKLPDSVVDSVVQSEDVQSAAKECLIYWLTRGNADLALNIKEQFNLPDSVVQSAAKEGMLYRLKQGNTSVAIKLKEQFNLPDSVVQSADVQSAAKECLIYWLTRDHTDLALNIKEQFNLPDSVVQSEDVQSAIKGIHPLSAYRVCLILHIDATFTAQMWERALSEIENDDFYGQKFTLARTLWGQNAWDTIARNNEALWYNLHDNLLFFGTLEHLSPEDQQDIYSLILKPFVTARFSRFVELNEALGYFSIDRYREKCGGTPMPFTNLDAFYREAQMQRYDIQVPEGASDAFRNAIGHLISVKGVDVPFLREMIAVYEQHYIQDAHRDGDGGEHGTNEDDDNSEDYSDEKETWEEFAEALIASIEGRHSIAERKHIAPWSETFPLDPLHSLVSTSVGIHSLNSLTPKLQDHVNQQGTLAPLQSLLVRTQKSVSARVNAAYEAKIASDPSKTDRLKAERNRELKKKQLVIPGKDEFLEGVGGFDEASWQEELFEVQEEFVGLLTRALEDENLRTLAYQSLCGLAEKSDAINNCVDLIPYRDALITAAEGLKSKYDRESIVSATAGEFLHAVRGKEIALCAYLLYLGLNNRTRQSESKSFKKSIDSIIKQARYTSQLDVLRRAGQVPERTDVFVAYTLGKLHLDPEDEQRVRVAVTESGYGNVGRSMKAEIASGDDYTAWTCGDETDCCMPFTSTKNQEYLLRKDTAYFVVKVVDPDGTEEIVAQSVLVEAQRDAQPDEVTIAIDNIEVANRALYLRPIIKIAYEKLKKELVARYHNTPLRIVIGTSYNDDGGTITGGLHLDRLDARPTEGELGYSDCFSHTSAYTFYTSEQRKEAVQYYGVAIDMLEQSRVYELVQGKDEREKLKEMLECIGKGEDDGDGGLSFPDNYSVVFVDTHKGDKVIGCIIAADYLTDEGDDDLLYIETLTWHPDVTSQEAKENLREYLRHRGLLSNEDREDIDGVTIRAACLAQNAYIKELFSELYGSDHITYEENGDMTMRY